MSTAFIFSAYIVSEGAKITELLPQSTEPFPKVWSVYGMFAQSVTTMFPIPRNDGEPDRTDIICALTSCEDRRSKMLKIQYPYVRARAVRVVLHIVTLYVDR